MFRRLLFVNGHLNVGGVERSLLDVLTHLDYKKYEVDLLLLEERGDYIENIPPEVNVIYVNTTKAYGPLISTILSNVFSLRWSMVLYRLVLIAANVFGKRHLKYLSSILNIYKQYDVAIAYRVGACADIVAYAVKANKKMVWWHHGAIKESPKEIASYNEAWEHMDYVVSVSQTCKNMIAETFKYPETRIIVIPNMLDRANIYKLSGNLSPYPQDGELHFVSVGRLCVEKHFEDAIYVAKHLVENGIKLFHWYIIGEGELRNELSLKIAELNISDHISLIGEKRNPYPWIRYADLLIHPSYIESQCITVLEAMALETPCIVCRSAGPMEFMKDSIHGIMTGKDARSLYNGVKRIIDLKDKSTMVKNASMMVSQRFSPYQTILKLENLIW